ncbi:MAG: hypothetical protein E6J03_04365 [Chloroflexi bacterium]|nr:MAG: hypothetical protein E6J03_04365 [Chloroflexota bacterium]
MPLPPIEMSLPFDSAPEPEDDEVRRRLGIFPTLGSVYAASEERLREVVGTVAAARIRWFLDAPLGLPTAPPARRPRWRSAA